MNKLVYPILLVSLLINGYYIFSSKKQSQKDLQTVTEVIDGDTFKTQNGLSIRFDTLDAPKLTNCGGEEAKAALEKIILNKTG